MVLIVNGKEVTLQCQCLADLVDHYQLNRAHVVAEVDGEIVDRSQWESYRLRDGAKVELVHFVGGG